MKKLLLSIFLLSLYPIAESQTTIKISAPEVSYLNGILTVRYDITGCGTNEYVSVRLIILNSKGDTLRPAYVSGDLGARVSCGFGKKIEWNMQRDGVLIDEDIEVQVTGRPVTHETADYQAQDVNKRLTRGKVILNSVFVPGLGQAKASGKGGHLVFSGIVYGALGASVLYNLKSNKYYDDYLVASSGTARDDLFNKSEKAYNLSQYFLYGAAGAWAVNFIWSATIPIKELTNKKISVSLLTAPGNHYLVSAKWSF